MHVASLNAIYFINIPIFFCAQVQNKPTASVKGASSGGCSHSSLCPHQQLDRTETQQGVREGSGTAEHGGHYRRHNDSDTRAIRMKCNDVHVRIR